MIRFSEFRRKICLKIVRQSDIKIARSVFLFLIVLFNSSFYCRAAGRDAFSFLLSVPTPRAAALGESFVSVAEGPETVLYNPAGLAFQKQDHLYLQSSVPPFVEDIKQSNLIFVRSKTNGAWGAHTGVLHAGGFTRTVADASTVDGFSEIGEFSTSDLRVSFSAGRRISENFGIGAACGFIRESLPDVTAYGVATDMGLLFKDPVYPVQIGISVQNLGPQVKFKNDSFNLPQLLRIGCLIFEPQDGAGTFVPEGTFLSAEFFKPFRDDYSVRGGIEIPFLVRLLLRAGYKYEFKKQELGSHWNIPNGFTLGLGILMRQCQIDYAAISMGELGFSHSVALNFKWST